MRTIRARLSVWYTMAMAGTIAVFGVSLLLANRTASHAAVDERIAGEAQLAASLIAETRLGESVITIEDPRTGQPLRVTSGSTLLEGLLSDPLVVVNPEGRVNYQSPDLRRLGDEALEELRALASPIPSEQRTGTVRLRSTRDEMRFVVRPIAGATGPLGAVVVAAVPHPTLLATDQLVTSMLVIAPLILGFAGLLGYWLGGRALKSMDAVIDEVQAITDGRSLHKRLAVPGVQDEVGRLATTLNAMLARLEESFVALRRFTADASHELKTPLTVVRAGVERVLTTPGSSPETMEVLEETLVEINRMAEMLDALLTLARADEGRAPLHLEPVDLRAQVAEAHESAEMLAEPADVEVDAAIPDRPVIVSADQSRIRQLLINLLSNAVKYTPSGGSVLVSLEERNGDAILTVSDTGIGIAPGDLPRIFDRFWRADPARSRRGRSGVGLGLAISKWIAEAHGGTISVQSRPGRGTTFTVTLPLQISES